MRSIYGFFLLIIVSFTLLTKCKTNDKRIVKKYYNNGALKMEMEISEDSIPHGNWKMYYENGKILKLGRYNYNKFDGKILAYHINGKLAKEVYFINGKENGVFKTYYETGHIMHEVNWEDGLKNGKVVYYFPNGKIEQLNKYYKDTAIYEKTFDEFGDVILEDYNPIFFPSVDTIVVGDTFKVKTVLHGVEELKIAKIGAGSVRVTNKYNSAKFPFIPFTGVYEYKYVPTETGKYLFNLQLNLEDSAGRDFSKRIEKYFYVSSMHRN